MQTTPKYRNGKKAKKSDEEARQETNRKAPQDSAPQEAPPIAVKRKSPALRGIFFWYYYSHMKLRTAKRLEVFLEFLIFGIVMGVAEDLIAVKFATNEPITWHVIIIVTLVAIPFAIIGELVVDRKDLIPLDKFEEGFEEAVGARKDSGAPPSNKP